MNTLLRSLAFVVVLALSQFAQAAPYSALYVFGDSLSDNGNLAGLPESPPPPYFQNRFSNGPVAAEYLAGNLGLGAGKFFNYAVGGATTGLTNTYSSSLPNSGMLSQVGIFAGSHPTADPNALYMLWGGPNDFFAISNPSLYPAAITAAVTNILTEIGILSSLGAKHFLVPNMVNLGLTPRFLALGSAASADATLLSMAFNFALDSALPSFVTEFDTFGFMNDVVANPGAFGLSDISSSCFDGTSLCSNPDQYLFWDDVHPTTAAASILAAQFTAAVPEPGSVALTGMAILLLILVRLGTQWRAQRLVEPSGRIR